MNTLPAKGTFDWIQDFMNRYMAEEAYSVLESEPGAWQWMASVEPPTNTGFMFWNDPYLKKITANMDGGYSGTSYAITLRIAQQMAVLGWDTWAQKLLQSQLEDPSPLQ